MDAFAGSVAELGGTREAAQSDMEAMAKSFGFAGNSMEKILRTADKVQGMKFDKAKATLGALGVSDDKTVELMMKGRKELERMMGYKRNIPVSPERALSSLSNSTNPCRVLNSPPVC